MLFQRIVKIPRTKFKVSGFENFTIKRRGTVENSVLQITKCLYRTLLPKGEFLRRLLKYSFGVSAPLLQVFCGGIRYFVVVGLGNFVMGLRFLGWWD